VFPRRKIGGKGWLDGPGAGPDRKHNFRRRIPSTLGVFCTGSLAEFNRD
jgi:hypothetical protein